MRKLLGALAVLLLLLLSGCRAISDPGGPIADRAAVDFALSALRGELESIEGLTGVTVEPMPEKTDGSILIVAGASRISAVQAEAAVTAVVEALHSEALGGQAITFLIDARQGGDISLSTAQLSTADASAEVAYWWAFQEAFGAAVSLSLAEPISELRKYSRDLSAVDPGRPIDWDALRAVPDSDRASASWAIGAAWLRGSLPDARVTDLIDEVSAVLPTGSSAIVWRETSQTFETYVVSETPFATRSPASTIDWPRVVTVARVLAASDVSPQVLSYNWDGAEARHVHWGECARDDADDSLLVALVDAGVDLPAGSAAGYCSTRTF